MTQKHHFTTPTFTAITTIFVALLVISNVVATKQIEYFGNIIVDGAWFLFPLTYILGDVLAEVYGFTRARLAILLGLVMGATSAISIYLVQIQPPAADFVERQGAYEAILGLVPRIVLASLLGYLVGQLLNAWVLVKIKEITGEKSLWLRILASSYAGQLLDSTIFAFVAFWGIITGADFWKFLIFSFIWKSLIETVCFPATAFVIRKVKQKDSALKELV